MRNSCMCMYITVHRTKSILDCAENAVSEQCGAEIAGRLRDLDNKLLAELGCETYKERQ